MQAQRATVGDEVKVVMRARFLHVSSKPQAAGHAQMQKQQALLHIQQQVLAPPTQSDHLLTHQQLRVATQRPSQGLAHHHRFDPGSSDRVSKTAPRHFHFRQLRHTNNRATA